MMIHQLFPTN
jgi:hypothetical protein